MQPKPEPWQFLKASWEEREGVAFSCISLCHKTANLFQVTLFEVHFSCCCSMYVSANLLRTRDSFLSPGSMPMSAFSSLHPHCLITNWCFLGKAPRWTACTQMPITGPLLGLPKIRSHTHMHTYIHTYTLPCTLNKFRAQKQVCENCFKKKFNNLIRFLALFDV